VTASRASADIERVAAKRELGRLVVEEGEIKYIENSFWVALSNEVGMRWDS